MNTLRQILDELKKDYPSLADKSEVFLHGYLLGRQTIGPSTNYLESMYKSRKPEDYAISDFVLGLLSGLSTNKSKTRLKKLRSITERLLRFGLVKTDDTVTPCVTCSGSGTRTGTYSGALLPHPCYYCHGQRSHTTRIYRSYKS